MKKISCCEFNNFNGPDFLIFVKSLLGEKSCFPNGIARPLNLSSEIKKILVKKQKNVCMIETFP